MSNDVPKPPSLIAAVRAAHGLPPQTMAEELAERFEARLRANGGKWVPLAAGEREVPPPPSLTDAIRKSRTEKK